MHIELLRASAEDAEQIWKMQIEAFTALLEKYQDFDTSPACEPIEKVRMRLKQPYTYYYFIAADSTTVGAIRVVDKKDGGNKRISPVFVLPKYQGRGIAQSAIRRAEAIHGADDWELDTILQEKPLCAMYEKLGYRATGRTETINDKLTLVFFRK